MLGLLVKSVVRRKIVGLFALNSRREMYLRQVAREIEESPHAVGLELKHLNAGGLLDRIERGHQYLYKWNDRYPFASILRETVGKMLAAGDSEMKKIPDIGRRERLEKNLKGVVEDIVRYFDPKRIILFGSLAGGHVGSCSDIDLVIIKETSKPFLKRAAQFIDVLDYDVDIDFFIYTPREFEEALKNRKFFQVEIAKKGKVLYEKAA